MTRSRLQVLSGVVVLTLVVSACSSAGATEESPPSTSTTAAPTTTTEPAPTTTEGHEQPEDEVDPAELAAANLATAAFQDVAMAEAAGYASTIDALGCFEDPEVGGMGLHYLNESLMDDVVDATMPEALVYELNADAEITGLVAHEYIVPIDAWTGDDPPSLFGLDFHQHSTLPLWILHAWIWKDNPIGTFMDYNPKVRPCPEGVPIFGVDLP